MKRKILIVEDNVGLSQIQKDWLSRAGYEAVTAMSEPIARSLIRRMQFDLILSDVRLPGRRRHFPFGMAAQGEERHPVHHNDRIRFRSGRCAYHQTGEPGTTCPNLCTGITCWNWRKMCSIR